MSAKPQTRPLKFNPHSPKFLLEMLDFSLGNIFITDKHGIVQYVNQQTADTFGMAKEEILYRDSAELVAAKVISRSTSVMAIEQRKTVIGYVRTRIGVDLYNISTPVEDADGGISYVVTCGLERRFIDSFLGTLEEERRALEAYKNALAYYTDKVFDERRIVVKSAVMKDVFAFLDNICATDSTVILYGESGVGKDVVANYIHDKSPRHKAPFIPINCAAIPHELMESEFFGYERGAFTGAKSSGKPGIFEIANEGTLFLDEIAELPIGLQTKLLRVLESKEITRLGGIKPMRVNTRLIAATNRELEKMIEKGLFRKDLYYRLNVIPVTIPPLRERGEDIEPLTNLFLEEFNKKYSLRRRFANDVIEMFEQYSWVGNIRELKNIVERMVLTSRDNTITASQFDQMNIFWRHDSPQGKRPAAAHRRGAEAGGDKGRTLNAVFSSLEREKVLEAMVRTKGNKSEAAKALGISRGKLYRLLDSGENSEQIGSA